MSTQEQATLIGQELERELSYFTTYSVFYDNITDDEDFYVDVQPNDRTGCFTKTIMGVITNFVEQHNLCYFIDATISGKPRISIY